MISKPLDPVFEKIALECEEAGASKFEILKIIKSLDDSDLADMHALRKKIAQQLRELNSRAAETYESFNRIQVHTSGQTIEPFDRGNIVKSLLKETNIPRALAEKIGTEVEEQIKDLKISYINTALIRGLADVKLLQYGRDDIHWQYTRIGMPLYDVEKSLEKQPLQSRELLVEYNLFKVIPKKISDSHFDGDIFISFLEDFSSKPFALGFSPKFEKTFPEFLISLYKDFQIYSNISSIKPSINGLNLSMLNFLDAKNTQNISANISKVLDNFYENSQINSVVNFPFYLPEELQEFSKEKQIAFDFCNSFLKDYKKRSKNYYVNFCIENEFQVNHLQDKVLCPNIYFTDNSGGKQNLFSESISSANGILGVYSINLVKLALSFKKNESKFFDKLQTLLLNINELVVLKKSLLEKRQYFSEQKLDGFSSVVCFSPLMHAVRELHEKQFIDPSVVEFSNKVLDFSSKVLDKSVVISDFSEAFALKKFSDTNRKIFNFSSKFSDKTRNLSELSQASKEKFLFSFTARDKKQIIGLLKDKTKIVKFE
ncbi:MAG: anaerobic ribonucleoside-triphosphate reductase [Candidatus Diapherotrites archaeon]|nr:anaerobic ribonucleoside-triphosphate reductase [Candidatus Diapherotrites archaeon]